MAEPFDEALAAFMAQHKKVGLAERIAALRKQTTYLELDCGAKTQRAQERAYGNQLLKLRPR